MQHQKVTVKRSEEAEEGTRPGRVYRPNADIGESRDALWLSLDLPGVDEKTVQVGLHDGILTVEGRVSLEEYEDLAPVYTEYNVGNFERRFRISDRIDPKGIEARIENGVLHLLLTKAEEAKPRTIPVRAG